MTSYREILRLKSLGFNHSQIAASMEVSRQTAVTALQKAAEVGLNWQTTSELTDVELARLLFPQSDGQPSYKMPEYEYVHREMAKSGATLQLLWFEYQCRQLKGKGYGPFLKKRTKELQMIVSIKSFKVFTPFFSKSGRPPPLS